MNVIHRRATLADSDAVYSIYMEDAVIPFLGFDPMTREDFSKVMQGLVASGAFFVVEQAGRIQGFYKASRHEGRARHCAYLGTFAVSTECRGTGLAKEIIEEAISRLHAGGATRVDLMLEADNPRALRFYRKLGFELEGTLRAAYKRSSQDHYVDEYFMAKLLPSLPGKSVAQAPS